MTILAATTNSLGQTGTRRVMLISCDGLRPDAISAAGAIVLQELIAGGSYKSAALDEIPPITLPNHSSMVTGVGTLRHGVLLNIDLPGRIATRTIFDVAHDAGVPFGFYINKSKLKYLCPPEEATVWKHIPDVDQLADAVVADVKTNDLPLIFIHFGEPDGAGHTSGWMSEPYLAQVRRDAAAIGRILAALSEAGRRDETVVIVTADHGGHDMTHFLDIPEDRHIPFILNGPGIAIGRALCGPVRIVDAAATVLDILKLPRDSSLDGKPVIEAYADSPEQVCDPGSAAQTTCAPFPFLPLAIPLAVAFILWTSSYARNLRRP